MSRWRKIKKNDIKKSQESETLEDILISSSILARIKAFIVDMFMIMMPLAYLTTYVFMDGKDDFQGSPEARWAISLIYGFIIIVFWIAKGQTPGQKAYDVKLIDEKTKEKVSLIKAIIRYCIFIFSAVTILLAFIPFFRKDRKTIQDILTKTIVVDVKK